MKSLFASLFLSLSVGLSFASDAIAATGKIYREPDGAVTVYDLTPNSRVRFGVSNPARQLTSNNCGLLRINSTRTYPTATVEVNGQTYDPATLPRQILPPCRERAAGYSLDEERPTAFVSSDNGALIIPGLPTNARLTVTYPGAYRVVARRVNGCGFLRVRETETIKLGETMLLPTGARSVAEFRLADLPVLNGLLCFRSNVYLPVPWAGWPTAEAIPGSEIADLGESAILVPRGSTNASSPSGALGGGGGADGSGGGSSGGGSGGSSGNDGSGTGSDRGSSGTGGGGSSEGSNPSSGDDSGDSGSGSGPDPAMYDFTDATYNAAIHDYNGDGLVDDSNGDNIPDDRDGDSFPDGLWGPNDYPQSAGPGFTLPPNVDLCISYNGNLVATSNTFVRGQTYYFSADNGLPRGFDDPLGSPANYGETAGPAVVKFPGNYTQQSFNYYFDENDRSGYISRDDEMSKMITTFYFKDVPSCLIPPWLNP